MATQSLQTRERLLVDAVAWETGFSMATAQVEYFRSRADYAISQSDADFRTTVNSSPNPSDGCCYDARSFVQSGCSCDRNLLAQAAQRGVANNGIRIIARATQFSRCTSSQFGGGIGTGGC
ncbi:hypothetical protein WJX75_009370 [Coccomyxa subellipsoidea]|uniref:Uncharacterized protein n=1 Tax=Coccomyxa subellipsoidea TaxID=248742 RepID=A0ABR2YGY7_9CHLO